MPNMTSASSCKSRPQQWYEFCEECGELHSDSSSSSGEGDRRGELPRISDFDALERMRYEACLSGKQVVFGFDFRDSVADFNPRIVSTLITECSVFPSVISQVIVSFLPSDLCQRCGVNKGLPVFDFEVTRQSQTIATCDNSSSLDSASHLTLTDSKRSALRRVRMFGSAKRTLFCHHCGHRALANVNALRKRFGCQLTDEILDHLRSLGRVKTKGLQSYRQRKRCSEQFWVTDIQQCIKEWQEEVCGQLQTDMSSTQPLSVATDNGTDDGNHSKSGDIDCGRVEENSADSRGVDCVSSGRLAVNSDSTVSQPIRSVHSSGAPTVEAKATKRKTSSKSSLSFSMPSKKRAKIR